MARSASDPTDDTGRPILPWRIIGGLFLHLALPAYLVTMLGVMLVGRPAGLHGDPLVAFMIHGSMGFLAIYGAATLVGCTAAALLDPLLRRRRARWLVGSSVGREALSGQRLAGAIRAIAGFAGWDPSQRITRAAAALARGPWRHDEDPWQRLSADLAEAAASFARAIPAAAPDERAALVTVAATALEQLAAALADLAEDRGRLDRGDAHAIARYIAVRYGADDPAIALDSPRGPA